MKIRPVEFELFHAGGRTDGSQTDRWTDMTKLVITSRNLTNAPKMQFVPIKKHLTYNHQSVTAV